MRAASAWWSWRDRARSFRHARGKLKRVWPFTPNPSACDSAAGSCWTSWRHPWTSLPRRRCELTWSNTARPDRFGARSQTVAQPPKIDNELYMRDYSKCILCYKCVDACGVDAQNTFAISVAGRGFSAHISTEFDIPLT